MNQLIHILSHNIIPVFLVVAAGFMLERVFTLDVKSLTKINFYLITPVFIFTSLYTAGLPDSMGMVMLFALLYLGLNWSIGMGASKVLRMGLPERSALLNAQMFYNSGNMGLPIIILVFSQTAFEQVAIAIQIGIMVFQSVGNQTLGFVIAFKGSKGISLRDSLRHVFSMPAIYAAILALLFKPLSMDLTELFFWPALSYVRQMMIGTALVTFGIQLGKTSSERMDVKTFIPVTLRLIAGPLVAYLLIISLRFDPLVSRVLLISSAMPSAVNTALIAVESDNAPHLASRVVLFSTLFSVLTITAVIAISSSLF